MPATTPVGGVGEVRPAVRADALAIRGLLAEAFSLTLPDPESAETLTLDGRWVMSQQDSIVATAVAMPGAQWFGGREVGSSLVRAVAVGSTSRGSGVGLQLMSAVLGEQRARGLALSSLFPSVPGTYRRVGYEYAGERQLMTASLAQVPRTAGPEAERLPLARLDEVRACYTESAAARPSAVARDPAWWDEILLTPRSYLFAVREEGRVTGYVLYTKENAPGHDLPYYFDVIVQDVAWTTHAAGLSLLSLLGSHSGLGLCLRWPGHAGDLWSRALRGVAPRVAFAYPWMLRIVDVARALSERGYPQHVSASVELTIVDDSLPANAGSYRLEVQGGSANVTQVEHAAATLDVGALAPLYTGYLDASQLAAEGRLNGAAPADVAALNSLFAGPRPLLTELF